MKRIFTLLIILFLAISFTACEFGDDIDVGNAYRFRIMATDGPFTGYYMLDGGSPKIFNSTDLTGSIFTNFEQNLSAPESVYVFATGENTDATSISIYVYADSKLVKDVTAVQTTDSGGNPLKVTVSTSYDFTK